VTPETQFWWNWWVSAAVAFGTVAAALVALFGQAFRSKFFPPRLSLSLVKPEGERTPVKLSWLENGEARSRLEEARYYHLRVSNDRRWSPANQVQVFLLRTEELGPDGELRTTWVGDVPMRWRSQETFPIARTIGPSADADLCCVVKGKWLELLPLVTPYSLAAKRNEATSIVLSLQVRANEADSGILRVQASWDGRWEDGAQEMMRHLVVKVLEPQET
jgi:hypothetical protein